MKQPKKAPAQAQQLYDWVMKTARQVIYGTSPQDHQRFDMLVQKLKSAGGEVGDVIGQTAALVLFNVRGSATKAGTPLPDDIIFAAGRELIADIMHIAQAAGALPAGKQSAIEQQAIKAGLKAYATAQNPAPPQAGPPSAGAPQPPQAPPPQQPQGIVQGAMAGA